MAHDSSPWVHSTIRTHPADDFAYGGDTSYTVDGATDWIGVACSTPDAMKLTGGAFYCDALTGYSPYFVLELWPLLASAINGVDTSGTVLATTAAFACTATTRMAVSFITPYTATQGQPVGLILKHSSGTIDGSNKITVRAISGRAGDRKFPHILTTWDGGSSWTASGNVPAFTITTDQDYDIGGTYTEAYSFPQFILDADTDRVANKFVMPSSTKPLEITVSGFRYNGLGPSTGDEAIAGVWNAAGTLLAGATIDPEWQSGYGDSIDAFAQYNFTSDVTFESGGTYYMGWERPTGGTSFQTQNYLVSRGANTVNNLKGFRSWPMGINGGHLQIWDSTDGTPAWKDQPAYPCTRLLIEPVIRDLHGKYEEAEVCAPAVLGKGDRGEKTPLDCAKTEAERQTWKTGRAKKALGKVINRTNGGYGWNPYA